MSENQGLPSPFVSLADLQEVVRSLATDKGNATGTFVELVPGYLYVATGSVQRGGTRVQQGLWFVRDERMSTKKRIVFRAYDNAYNVIRGYGTYAKGWGMFQLSALHNLHSLAMADLAGTWFLRTMSAEEYDKLVKKCAAIIASKGTEFTKNTKVQRAIENIVAARQQDNRSRQRLGYTNAAGKIAERIKGVTGSYDVIVTLSTVTAQYMGAVLDVVKQEREKLNRILALGTDALFDEGHAHALFGIGGRVFRACVARPTTHVGEHATRDCGQAAELIRKGIVAGPSGRAGMSEGIRNLLGNARDSLDFLLWQYDVATFVAEAAPRVRTKELVGDDVWRAFVPRIAEFGKRIAPPFGARFASKKPLEDARAAVEHARVTADRMATFFDPDGSASSLAVVKEKLVIAMRCV